jgi:hypothetical protein
LNEYWKKLNLFRIQKKAEEIREKVATATVDQKTVCKYVGELARVPS